MVDIIIVLSLLMLGYGFGSYRERKHFQSILERERKFKDILVFESKQIPSPARDQGGDLVQGNVVISVDYFKMFVAGMRSLIGGRLRSYETLLDRGRREAVLRMKEEAAKLGSNQIFNVRFETASISKGQSGYIGSVEVLVYGSAINHR